MYLKFCELTENYLLLNVLIAGLKNSRNHEYIRGKQPARKYEFLNMRRRTGGIIKGWCKLRLVTYDAFIAMDFWKNKNLNVKNQY